MLLSASGLVFQYPHTNSTSQVLNGISLSLSAGEVVALLGPNGSGKSTLLHCLLGQLKSTGAIRWDDRALAEWKPRDLARRVAFLSQHSIWEPAQSVRAALALGRAPYWGAFGVESRRDVEVIESVAVDLHLTDLLHRPLGELSGGQRQRVLLGRCLVQEPAALLLDEPNTYLDLRHQVDLAQLLRRLASEKRLGVLMASHDLNLAGTFADRLILLHQGKIVADGPVSEVLRPDLLGEVYGVKMERIEREGQAPVVVPVAPSTWEGEIRMTKSE